VAALYEKLTHIEWITLTAAALIGYGILSLLLHRSAMREMLLDQLGTAGILALLVWKLFPLLVHPKQVLTGEVNLLALLLSSGPEGAKYAGLAAGAFYLASRLKGMPDARSELARVLPYGLLSSLAAWAVLRWEWGKPTVLPWGWRWEESLHRYHPVVGYHLMLALLLASMLYVRHRQGKPGSFYAFLLWLGAGLLLISATQFVTPVMAGLSWSQCLWLALAIIGAWGSSRVGSGSRHGQRKKGDL